MILCTLGTFVAQENASTIHQSQDFAVTKFDKCLAVFVTYSKTIFAHNTVHRHIFRFNLSIEITHKKKDAPGRIIEIVVQLSVELIVVYESVESSVGIYHRLMITPLAIEI